MNDLDAMRMEHASAGLAKGYAALESDPLLAYYHIWSGRMLLISTKLKNNRDLPRDDVHAIIQETIDANAVHNVVIALEKQNQLLVLALAAGDIDGARHIASIECNHDDSHRFDIRLNYALRSFFVSPHSPLSYSPSKFEQLLFDDLDSIACKRQTDLTGTDTYWNVTKSKCYAGTVFEHSNLFRQALEHLNRM